MISSFMTKWGREHVRLAEKIYSEHQKNTRKLPQLPTNLIEWVRIARPIVEGKQRNFLTCPFWVPIYQDTHGYQMVIGGRQIYKSTACTDFIAAEATSHDGIQVCYVTHDDRNLSMFSKQKLRIGTFLLNPVLAKFLRHPGNVGEISLKNNSTIYLVTDNYQYRHVEGKSPALCIIDEAQYQDIEHLGKVHQTMMATKGALKILGIGGEAGSAYEKLWHDTNQMEWIYDDPDWRNKLQFDEKGLVVDDYLKDILKGRWVAQKLENNLFHGYHIPQTIFPTIPLTVEDAIHKYKIHPRYSIEYQKKTLPHSKFASHVMGSFYNSPKRPITRETVLRCMEPYRYLSLQSGNEVANLKKTFGNEITVGMGVDFGSGLSSVTAISILIWWRKPDRIQVAFIEKRPPENQLEQAEHIVNLFNEYCCDIGVGDLGYGANQVKLIQDGGYNQSGIHYDGVTNQKFFGCRSISDVTKPLQIFDETTDEHGEQVGRVQIDKTSGIEFLIDSMKNLKTHPVYPDNISLKRPKLLIPSRYDYETAFLVDELTSITRKDLDYLEDAVIDSRQKPRKEYNHPPDSVMSIVYGIVSLKVKEQSEWHWVSA